jgi:hypothetical protein
MAGLEFLRNFFHDLLENRPCINPLAIRKKMPKRQFLPTETEARGQQR